MGGPTPGVRQADLAHAIGRGHALVKSLLQQLLKRLQRRCIAHQFGARRHARAKFDKNELVQNFTFAHSTL